MVDTGKDGCLEASAGERSDGESRNRPADPGYRVDGEDFSVVVMAEQVREHAATITQVSDSLISRVFAAAGIDL